MLLTRNITRAKHSVVLAAFREQFIRPGIFPTQDSHAYGEAFELRNVTDYEMLGQADEAQSRLAVANARTFIARCETYLAQEGFR